MSESQKLSQLQQMLTSDLIRKRKTGIAMAAEMLASDAQAQSEAVRVLLDGVAKNDAMLTVREAAQAALDADEARRNPPPPDYVFGAKCPHCHSVTQLDKRVVCPNQGNVTREVIVRDGLELDTILVTCKHCGQDFKTPVPCKGYK
jgi:glutaredoxin